MTMTRVQKTWAAFLATRVAGLVVDGAVLAAAYCGAFALRYDFHAPRAGWRAVALSFVLVFMVHIASLIACGCYRLAWRRISRMDVPRYLVSTAISCVALTMMRFFTPLDEFMHVRPPYSVTVMTFILASAGLIGWRLAWSCAMRRRERADDLLDRKVREMDTAAAARFLGGRTVMVTGAGGTIGSELVRQVAAAGPARILLVERGENALYQIDRRMRAMSHFSG